jgi:DNA-binding LacI/PurR family transcriptional regulator
VFFNKNIHREEISSLLLMLPAFIAADPDHKELLSEITRRIDNIVCLELSIYNLPALIVDLAAAAQMAVEHLISLGHRRIGFLAVPDQRMVGYRRALGMHDIPFDETLLRELDPPQWLSSTYDLTSVLSRRTPTLRRYSP